MRCEQYVHDLVCTHRFCICMFNDYTLAYNHLNFAQVAVNRFLNEAVKNQSS
jgi:hypothetical protein